MIGDLCEAVNRDALQANRLIAQGMPEWAFERRVDADRSTFAPIVENWTLEL